MWGEWSGRRQEKVWGDALQMTVVFQGSHLRGQDYCGIKGKRFYVASLIATEEIKWSRFYPMEFGGLRERKSSRMATKFRIYKVLILAHAENMRGVVICFSLGAREENI